MNPIDWKVWANRVHLNALEHGWWEKPRRVGECMMLISSEIAEATESVRDGNPPVYVEDIVDGKTAKLPGLGKTVDPLYVSKLKPEGEAIELVDAVIRALDLIYADPDMLVDYGDWNKEIFSKKFDYKHDWNNDLSELTPLEVHWELTNILVDGCKSISDFVCAIQEYFEYKGWDLEDLIKVKHEYNKSRPYRHGGKLL